MGRITDHIDLFTHEWSSLWAQSTLGLYLELLLHDFLANLIACLTISPAVRAEVIERDIGVAGVKYDSREAIVDVVVAAERDAQVLGVTTLESLGYRMNPMTEKPEYVGLLAV